jgi:hypothetical protein
MEDDLVNHFKKLNITIKSKNKKHVTINPIISKHNKIKDIIIYDPFVNFQKKYTIPFPLNTDNVIIPSKYTIIIDMLSVKYNRELIELCFKYLIKVDTHITINLAIFIHHTNCYKLIKLGWKYGDIYKYEDKEIPTMVSFDYLPKEEKNKLYDMAIEIISVNV